MGKHVGSEFGGHASGIDTHSHTMRGGNGRTEQDVSNRIGYVSESVFVSVLCVCVCAERVTYGVETLRFLRLLPRSLQHGKRKTPLIKYPSDGTNPS